MNAIQERIVLADNALAPYAWKPLPLGTILPLGWLKNQLRIQANGLTGHLDEFWPSVADSRWIGGTSEGWERAPYWLDGLVPLAVLLDDPRLLAKARRWIDYILTHQHADGWLGPIDDPHEGTGEVMLDPWPQFVLFKALTQWQEATGDSRVIPAMLRAMRRIADLLDKKPLRSWGRMRWADLVVSLFWLHERAPEPWLLEMARVVHAQGYDWNHHFDHFQYREKTENAWLQTHSDEECLPLHGVNNAMGIKSGAVWSRLSGSPTDAHSSLKGVRTLDTYHGQVTGMFSGDEHLAGLNPSQGTETCTVVEYLFSLEQMLAVSGDAFLADKWEQIAFNALPAAMGKDMWTRQYDQQPNQVLCSVDTRDWVSNGPKSNVFSLEGNFGCCTANLHQGWPKFASHLWMASPDSGLTAVAYAPCAVTMQIGGARVTLMEETEYPFRSQIRFTVDVDAPLAFPLNLRIPEWADGATVMVNSQAAQAAEPGTFYRVSREWHGGDTIILNLPLRVRREPRSGAGISLLRGPLVMALRIGEAFRPIGGEAQHPDFEAHPTTPWNFALSADTPIAEFAAVEADISAVPFDPAHPPLIVSAPACRLPDWTLHHHSAADPPPAFIARAEHWETITLVPYGSTYLRISEMPEAL